MFDRVNVMGDIVLVHPITSPELQTQALANRWQNVNNIDRTYNALEIEFNTQFTKSVSFGGNATYSIMRGNVQGDNSNPPVTSSAMNSLTSVHDKYGRDSSYYAPEGYLTGDIPYRLSAWLSYSGRHKTGASMSTTLLFNYTAAGPTSSAVGGVLFEARAEALRLGYTEVYGQYDNSYTRYFGTRGYYRTNDTYSFDLQVNLELPLYRKVRLFTEMTVTGLFNQWMLTGHGKDTQNVATGQLDTHDPRVGGWFSNSYSPRVVPGGINNYGWGSYGYSSMTGQRNVVFSAGLKW